MPILVRLRYDRLRDLIARSNLSQNHWAIRIGISRGHWSEIVNGKHPYPSPKTRERMLEVFGVEFDELFETETIPAPWSDPGFHAAIRDRYLIDEEVGHGGMGIVYLARDVKLRRRVAIKSISAEVVSGIGFEQFLKEIRYSARLHHQHVLPLYDAGEAAGQPYYVMPYVGDGSLRHLLDRKGRLSLGETVRIVGAVGAALDHAHGEHVLHCDVKPENVLLHRGHVYVADFGVARAIHAEMLEWGRPIELDSSAGTPAYVSPEQASGERNLDARADVYSLACMAYEMLTGRPPFTGRNSMEVVAQRFTSPVPDVRSAVPELPVGVSVTLERAMALAPARRTRTARGFTQGLAAAARHHGKLGRAAATGIRLTRSWVRRAGLSRLVPAPGTRGNGLLAGLHQDLRQAWQTLRRAPGFAVVTILTLALGIGANTAIFTLVNGTLLRPLPYAEPDQLVMLWEYDTRAAELAAEMRAMDDDPKWTVSPANYMRWRERTASFSDMAAFNIWRPTLIADREPEELNGSIVTPNFFGLMGVAPILGAGFTADHGRVAQNDVVLLSQDFWQRRFGGDSSILGRSIRLSGDLHTVIGIIPSSYRHPDPNVFDPVDVWRPIAFEQPRTSFGRYLRVVGRLRREVTRESAERDMHAIAAELETITPEQNAGWNVSVVGIRDELFGDTRGAMFMLLGAAGFVLLIACTNVANVVLARSHGRRREFAVRTALGAGRRRLARQMIVENTLLAVAGGLVGLFAVRLGSGFLQTVQGRYLSNVADIRIDLTVVVVMVATALASGIVFGILPVIQTSRSDLRTALMEESAGAGVGRRTRRLRAALVVAQIGLAAVLVVGAGLLTRSFIALLRVPPGFDVQHVLTGGAVLPRDAYADEATRVAFFDQLLPRIEAVPGVNDVALVSDLPFTTENRFQDVNPLDALRPEGEELLLEYRTVGPGYFRTMGIPILAGRDVTRQDRADGPPVVVINREFADRLWPGQDPVGKQFVSGRGDVVTVVGIVGNILDDGFDADAEPRFFQPYAQHPARSTHIVLRIRGDAASVRTAIQREIATLDPTVVMREFREMDDIVAETVADDRMAMSLAGLFSTLAVLLAAVGIYGVMSYAVGERRREIGVRRALGARRTDVMGLVFRQSILLTAVGTVIGVSVAAALSRTLSAYLFSVRPSDPVTLAATPLLLGAVALIASYRPAARAIGISPLEALRAEH